MEKKYAKLRVRIFEKYGSQKAFADALGVTIQTVGAKLNGRTEFSQADILKWCELLDIGHNEIGLYFFAN